jgi:hypothetical protein
MLDRRQFTFASLVTLISSSAAAAAPIPQQQPTPKAAGRPSLVPTYVLKRKGNEVQIHVAIRNVGAEPVDMLVALGSRPGPRVTATLPDGAELEEIVEVGRRDIMSRIGPMPHYSPIAAGASVDIGTYRFVWLASRPDPVLSVVAEVYTGDEPVVLSAQQLSMAVAGT